MFLRVFTFNVDRNKWTRRATKNQSERYDYWLEESWDDVKASRLYKSWNNILEEKNRPFKMMNWFSS